MLGNVRLAQTNDPEVAKGSVFEAVISPLQVLNTATKMIIAHQNQPRPFPHELRTITSTETMSEPAPEGQFGDGWNIKVFSKRLPIMLIVI